MLRALKPAAFVDETFGLPTVTDILRELEKPGRDPRPAFKTATFLEGVEKVSDLKPGMLLEGTVTNVAAFGAFVDVGVHQDGLVHVSAMSKTFVKDPREVVKPGDVVKVKVLEVDVERKRISLTLRLDDPLEPAAPRGAGPRQPARSPAPSGGGGRKAEAPSNNAFADALRRAAEARAVRGTIVGRPSAESDIADPGPAALVPRTRGARLRDGAKQRGFCAASWLGRTPPLVSPASVPA